MILVWRKFLGCEEGPRTLKELVDHWLDTECPEADEDPNERRAFSTRDNYRGYLRKWVKPRCGDQALDEVKAVAIESWLSTLKKDDSTALADGSKKKIRGLRHLLYEHAIRYEWTDRNPITSVRQSGVRQATPIRLSVDQLSPTYYGELKQRERVMVLLDFGRIPFSIV
jgi:site-specific recombinase XerD